MKPVFAVLSAIPFFLGIDALAQEGNGVLNAFSLRPVPADSSVSVDVNDDSRRNLAALEAFKTRLADAGYRIEPEAPLIMTLEVLDVGGAWSDDGQRTILEFEGKGDGISGQNHKLRFNLFDSNQGGIFNRGQTEGGTHIVTPVRFRLNVTLVDRSNGRRLWQGSAEIEKDRQDEMALIRGMTGPLAAKVGETVRQQTFSVP